MCHSTRMLITNGVPLWPNTNDFTCGKHNGNSMIDYVLLSECILDYIHKFSLGEWTQEYDHRTLCINLKYMKMLECENPVEGKKTLCLSINP